MRVLLLIDIECADCEDPQLTRRRHASVATVESHVASALRRLGHEVTILPFDRDAARALHRPRAARADLVFNLTEQFDGDRRKDAYIASCLERLHVPYTGAGPAGLTLCRDKAGSKRLLKREGFDVPGFNVLSVGERRLSRALRYPVLVKPLMADASEHMARTSLAPTARAALARVAWLHERTGQPVICEEFIDGRELKIALLGNERPLVLPPREVRFGRMGCGGPIFITSRVKGDPDYRRTWKISYPRARLSAPEFRRLAASAQRIYRLLEMRDYGKIDIRLTPNGRMVFIEGNPNPDLSPTGFGRMASWAGYAYTDVIRAIVDLAVTRYATSRT
jgi:D-alanine-D-alanine ligase